MQCLKTPVLCACDSVVSCIGRHTWTALLVYLSPRAVTAIWWHSLPHMSGSGAGCQLSHICVRSPQPSPVGTGFPVNSRTEQAQCTSAFQASACVTFVMSHWPNHNRSWPNQFIGPMWEVWQISKDTGIGIHEGGVLLLEQPSVLWPLKPTLAK
jgi:hypothetical protein